MSKKEHVIYKFSGGFEDEYNPPLKYSCRYSVYNCNPDAWREDWGVFGVDSYRNKTIKILNNNT